MQGCPSCQPYRLARTFLQIHLLYAAASRMRTVTRIVPAFGRY